MRRVTRRLFNVLAAVSLMLCVATVALWQSSPSYPRPRRISFNLFAHPVVIFVSRSDVDVRVWAATTIMLPHPQLSARDTGVDVGSFRNFYFGFAFGTGYTITNLAPTTPPMVPARTWATVMFPFWTPTLLLALSSAMFMYVSFRMQRAQHAGHCAMCGYDLRATPDRCPECGTVRQTNLISNRTLPHVQ